MLQINRYLKGYPQINGIDSIYWINLDRSIDRKDKMDILFNDDCFKHVPKIERFTAFDGKKINIHSSFILKNNFSSNNEYGCLLSHLEIIRNFLNDDTKSIIMICEDDITLDLQKYWKDNLSEVIKNAPEDWEIIMLTYTSQRIPVKLYTENNPHGTYTHRDYFSSGCYIINKKGAQNIIDELYDYESQKYMLSDNYYHAPDILLFIYAKTYVYKYPYFIYKYKETSTISCDDGRENYGEFYDQSRYIIEKLYVRENMYIRYIAYIKTLYFFLYFFAVSTLFIIKCYI
jgi:GR25 family glycosyltransferase involved in LPS biosynthesis